MSEDVKPEAPPVKVFLEYTPNPMAFKFICSVPVMGIGKITYGSAGECSTNPLAQALFLIEGVKQLHFFENVITVTFNSDIELGKKIESVKNLLISRLPAHDPFFKVEGDENERRSKLPPELLKIEEILDKTIRPGLQGDGGDLEVLSLEGKTLSVRYQGACGSCPSSTQGTLMAIQGILREQYDPELDIITV